MRKRARRLGRVGWTVWFLGGVAVFALLRLLTWWTVRQDATVLIIPAAFATAAAWLILGMAVVLAAHSAWDAHRRRSWAIRQNSIEAIRRLSWSEFERLVAEVFAQEGYKVDLVGQGGADGGIDVVLHRSGEETIVQCKHWKSNKVGVAVAREMLGLLIHYRAARVAIVSTYGFTKEACTFAAGKPIRLIDGAELLRMIKAAA